MIVYLSLLTMNIFLEENLMEVLNLLKQTTVKVVHCEKIKINHQTETRRRKSVSPRLVCFAAGKKC